MPLTPNDTLDAARRAYQASPHSGWPPPERRRPIDWQADRLALLIEQADGQYVTHIEAMALLAFVLTPSQQG